MAADFRVAVGGILTECNHLGGLPIDMELYESSQLLRGEELLTETSSVIGGVLQGLRTGRAETLPLLFASACAAGPIQRDCYLQLRGELLDRLRACLPVDGVLLPLHGAALAEEQDDPEGDLLGAVREIVGPHVPVIATLDLHAHVTAEMVRHADAMLAWETYPHRDQFTTGERAARLLLDTLAGHSKPTMAMAKVPVLTSAIHGSTDGDDPFADLMRYTKSVEQQAGVLSTSLFLIHPYMDCAGMGSGGLVVTDNDLELARQQASEIAVRYWERRHDLEPDLMTPERAIATGRRIEGGPVLLIETADCCGGGAAGDSVATLSALVEYAREEPALVPVIDPPAAQQCHAAGVGAELTLTLGHKLDSRWGQPRSFTGVIEQLSAGSFTYSGGQWDGRREQMGPTAVLRVGAIQVVIMSRATYDWAGEQFASLGLRPEEAKFVVVKNPMNYRLAYGSIARAEIVLDTPGPTPATVKHVQFRKLSRPYFPADHDIPGMRPVVLT